MTSTQPNKGAGQRRPIEQFNTVRTQPALGQAAPAATSATTLYTCPVQRTARGRVFISEQGGSSATYRLSLRPDGDAQADKHYLVYDRSLAANDDEHTVELFLDTTDVLTVYASTGDLNFSFIGQTEPKDRP